MLLTIAYVVYIIQIVTISLLMLPIPIKFRKSVTELAIKAINNYYVRIFVTALILFMVGSFVENLYTSLKYDDVRYETAETIATSSMKHELLMKLFRAQRNVYLTFSVNFNWVVLWGINRFIKTIYILEIERSNNNKETEENTNESSEHLKRK
jgi:hypothetical protein